MWIVTILIVMNKYIPRWYKNLADYMRAERVLLVFGPRRVGKTTLIRTYLSSLSPETVLELSGDQARTAETFSSQDEEAMMNRIGQKTVIFIDEAQKIPGIGQNLKLLIDTHPELQIIATGSAAFELAGQVGEPLTGRKVSLQLYPLSVLEMARQVQPAQITDNLEQWMVWGMYPEIMTASGEQERSQLLQELLDSYLYKDILELERVKSAKLLRDLLQLIAFQIGSEVSLNELAGQLGIDVKTVARYLDLFEKSFILYNVRGFSRNLRKEVSKKSKYYFYDTGIRNAVINNLNPVSRRNDAGQLWENFAYMERIKSRGYLGVSATDYFWRTWDKKEVDLIEQRGGQLYAYEFKWSDRKKSKPPQEFLATYPDSTFQTVSPLRLLQFLRTV